MRRSGAFVMPGLPVGPFAVVEESSSYQPSPTNPFTSPAAGRCATGALTFPVSPTERPLYVDFEGATSGPGIHPATYRWTIPGT
jgi:hypothetical protein